jgi:membrane complex biogenesis BtpA family protein
MLHLLPLPGSPRYANNFDTVHTHLLSDAQTLADGGVHGLMLENFGDVPFYPAAVPPHVVACMTALARGVRERVPLPLGINVLRNDGRAALAVAVASGARFIRVNVLCGARVADQGLIHGIAHDLLRDRMTLGTDVRIFADVDVKHSASLAPRALSDEVSDTLHRGLADALIVSGTGTGRPTNPEHLRAVKQAAGSAPVFIGSGVTLENVSLYRDDADGFIIGTAFKPDGDPAAPVNASHVRALLDALR